MRRWRQRLGSASTSQRTPKIACKACEAGRNVGQILSQALEGTSPAHPRSRASGLQTKTVHFCCFSHSLWSFVTAGPATEYQDETHVCSACPHVLRFCHVEEERHFRSSLPRDPEVLRAGPACLMSRRHWAACSTFLLERSPR